MMFKERGKLGAWKASGDLSGGGRLGKRNTRGRVYIAGQIQRQVHLTGTV